jgi:hypothetical protein
MKVNGRMEKNGTEHILGLVEQSMLGNGEMAKKMVKEHNITKKVNSNSVGK